jgi:hypothetical protein
VTGFRHELSIVWPRMLAGRVLPILIGGSMVLVAAVRVIAPVPAGPTHSELAKLQGGNEITGFVLMIVAFVSAYLLLAPDLHDEFESMSASGATRPLTFAAARVLVGAAALVITAAALGIAIEALDAGGRFQKEEALHLVVLFANSLPVFMLALALTCIFGRVAAVITAFFLLSVGADAAYQRAALSDHFIDSTGLYSAEQFVAWFAPRSLLDPFPGIALKDLSAALQQFPVREGQAVWGGDLIQVSGSADIVQFAAYLVALAAVLYIACVIRARRARSRFHLVPAWLEQKRR